MGDHSKRAERIMQRIDELASISEDEGRITRTYGTRPFIQGRNKVEQWMKEAGLDTRIDNIGNVRGRLDSNNAKAQTFVIASHIDTVVNAGRFDGPMGVLIGLDLAAQLGMSGATLPYNIEVIGFCDEEGCRFHTTYLGSKALIGKLESSLLDAKDATGMELSHVITQMGGDINKLNEDLIEAADWEGYFEIHIEQGPVLFERDIPVGVVSAIAGQYRAGLIFNGEAGHAGTVPMDMRKDALAGAAEFVMAVENFASKNGNGLVATVGKLHIINSASNVIPGEVICSLDVRHANEMILSQCYDSLQKLAKDICEKRGLTLDWNLVQHTKPVTCDEKLTRNLKNAISDSGYEVVELVSGAGHDAVPISSVSPVVMLFVRCYKGISHNPLENVEMKDLIATLKVSDNFIKTLIAK
ncbi:MAG: allantoate amidohydrolase [Chitinophagaceae bacterium]|nr:allantoate amidohydrolase [Chitinophagaceae bacterium]